jgi:hypothetical protein
VTSDSGSAGDATASEHADVSCGGKKEDACHEEAHGSGSVLVGVVDGPNTEGNDGGGSTDANE